MGRYTDSERRTAGACTRQRLLALVLAAFFALVLFCGGCSRKVYVPAERAEISMDSDSLSRIVERLIASSRSERDRETLYVFSKEIVTMNEAGDTMRHDTRTVIDRSRELERENMLLIAENDSLRHRLENRDSVYIREPYPVPEPYVVEKPLPWWRKMLQVLGGLSLVGTALTAAVLFRRRR